MGFRVQGSRLGFRGKGLGVAGFYGSGLEGLHRLALCFVGSRGPTALASASTIRQSPQQEVVEVL